MPFYRSVGDVPRKRHRRVRHGGGYLAEELVGTDGFSQDSALLYHLSSPSAVVAVEPVDEPGCGFAPDRPLVPRHLRTGELAAGSDIVTGRHPVLGNDDVTLSFVHASGSSPLYRHAGADELIYLHRGAARLDSVFGSMAVEAGDYVVVPAGITHRWVVESGPAEVLVLAGRGHIGIPERYLTARGQLREGAPYSERDLRAPEAPLLEDGVDVPVLVRNQSGLSRHVHARHPFDVVGWDGALYPWAFSIHDFEPIVGASHQPPPVHQTFGGRGFVVCSFVPRPYDFGPEAVKVPYHHANVDSDEVLFYSDGDFMSRKGAGIGPGSITFHPAGFTHGPQPGSLEAAIESEATDELAVMIDTFRPLAVSGEGRAISDAAYPWTWAGRHGLEP